MMTSVAMAMLFTQRTMTECTKVSILSPCGCKQMSNVAHIYGASYAVRQMDVIQAPPRAWTETQRDEGRFTFDECCLAERPTVTV